MITEDLKNMSIVVGGSVGMTLVVVGGFVLLCALSWAVMLAMDYGFEMIGYPARFGGPTGPAGLEILIGAFLILSMRRLTRIARPED